MFRLTCSYKVAVERMGIMTIADRFGCSHKGLTHNLTPKQALCAGHPVVSSSGEQKNTCRIQVINHVISPDDAAVTLRAVNAFESFTLSYSVIVS